MGGGADPAVGIPTTAKLGICWHGLAIFSRWHSGARYRCYGTPLTGVVIQKYREEEAEADQRPTYYHTTLHDCPPLRQADVSAAFGRLSDTRVVRSNRAWICTFGQVTRNSVF